MSQNLVFNTNLLPSLASLSLQKLAKDFPEPTLSGVEFESILHFNFFTSTVHQKLVEIQSHTGSSLLLDHISKSCPNLERLEISSFGGVDQLDIVNTFGSIASGLPKLDRFCFGMWKSSKADLIPLTNDM
ncbi:hypothetical protein H4219_006457, partial [Mycoemilia scoparia]